MMTPNVRSWTRAEIKEERLCEKCRKPLPAPIMTVAADMPSGPDWTHDRLPSGDGCWFISCPSCGMRNYFHLGDPDE